MGLDLDGVFADFNGHPGHWTDDKPTGPGRGSHGFARLLVETSGRDLFPRPWTGPTLWSWWRPLGYHTREADAAWRAVQGRTDFWSTLRPYSGAVDTLAVVRKLRTAGYLEPYFLTTRLGSSACAQSIWWLTEHALFNPQVVICPNADDKGDMARRLNLSLVVDDHCENLLAVKQHSTARLVLYDQPWSTNHRDQVLALGALPIRGQDQLADKLKEWAGV